MLDAANPLPRRSTRPGATDPNRTRELERICDAAETRLAHAERQAAHPGSDDSEEAR